MTPEEYEILLDLIKRIKKETDKDLKAILIEEVKKEYPNFEKDFLNNDRIN